MRAVIICGGDIGDAGRARNIIKKDDFIICADSGYKYASALEIKPDVVLGDFDSYQKDEVECENVKTYPVKKDFTDSEIAVQYALGQGADEIVLLASTGGRIDHALANIYLLKTISQSGACGMIFDGSSYVWYTEDKLIVKGKKGDLLSVIPFSEADCFTMEGLEYALFKEPLPSTGVSNVFSGDKASICFEKGAAIVVHTPVEFSE